MWCIFFNALIFKVLVLVKLLDTSIIEHLNFWRLSRRQFLYNSLSNGLNFQLIDFWILQFFKRPQFLHFDFRDFNWWTHTFFWKLLFFEAFNFLILEFSKASFFFNIFSSFWKNQVLKTLIIWTTHECSFWNIQAATELH